MKSSCASPYDDTGAVSGLLTPTPGTPTPAPAPSAPCDILFAGGNTKPYPYLFKYNGPDHDLNGYPTYHCSNGDELYHNTHDWCIGTPPEECNYYNDQNYSAKTADLVTANWLCYSSAAPGNSSTTMPETDPSSTITSSWGGWNRCSPAKYTKCASPGPAPTPAPAPGGECPAGMFCPLLADPSATGGCATGNSDYPPVLATTTTSSRAECEAKCAAAGAVCAAYQWCAIASDHGCRLMPAANYTRQNGYPSTFCMKRCPFTYPTMP